MKKKLLFNYNTLGIVEFVVVEDIDIPFADEFLRGVARHRHNGRIGRRV